MPTSINSLLDLLIKLRKEKESLDKQEIELNKKIEAIGIALELLGQKQREIDERLIEITSD